jgi:hypothetical protein
MNAFTTADTLHRLVKQALDSGAASSVAEAERIFAGYRVQLRIDPRLAADVHHQAALITAVALAKRVFLGGVTVSVLPDVPLLCPLPLGATLADAVQAAGASISGCKGDAPVIDIGGNPCERRHAFHVRALLLVGAAGSSRPIPKRRRRLVLGCRSRPCWRQLLRSTRRFCF